MASIGTSTNTANWPVLSLFVAPVESGAYTQPQQPAAQTAIPENGNVLQIAPGPLTKIGQVSSGYLCLDGNQLRHINSLAVKRREVSVPMAYEGVVSVASHRIS